MIKKRYKMCRMRKSFIQSWMVTCKQTFTRRLMLPGFITTTKHTNQIGKGRNRKMANIHSSITELVGHTPLVEFVNYEKELGLNAHLLGKLEYFNPSGSVKDRAALNMILEAEKSGKLKPGGTILDFTSGNTGIATAAFANSRGYKYVVVIQPRVSVERTLILKAYGVELLQAADVPGFMEMLQNGGLSMAKLTVIMNKYADEHGYFYIDQGTNPDNPEAHYRTTGPEIWEDTDGNVDYVVALVGTGGTLAGLSRYFREKNPGIKIIGAQPAVQSRKNVNHPEANTIDGVLAFNDVPAQSVPVFFNPEQAPYDECLDIVAEDAYETGRRLVKSDGVFLGQSAAAALKAATIIAERPEASGKNIAIIMADNAFKYLSTKMYAEG